MRESYEDARKKLCGAILDSSGDTTTALRKEIATYAEQLGANAADNTKSIPPEPLAYATKVARHAYKVTDEDIAALHDAGYSEDAIFELTLSVALGAGMVRLDSGLAALKGAIDATEKH